MRGESDAEHEIRVAIKNRRDYGISRFLYVMADDGLRDISSTAAREAAARLDFQALGRMLAPLAVSALLERTFGLANLFLVTGRPGGGKSTLLKRLAETEPGCVHVDTDRFLDDTKPMLRAKFGTDDLAAVAIARGEELKAEVGALWLARAADAVRNAPKGSDLFLEVPYALSADMGLYRLLGGKIVHVGCETSEHARRIRERGTPQHLPFIDRIPDWEGAARIAGEQRLSLLRVVTDGDERRLDASVAELLRDIRSGKGNRHA